MSRQQLAYGIILFLHVTKGKRSFPRGKWLRFPGAPRCQRNRRVGIVSVVCANGRGAVRPRIVPDLCSKVQSHAPLPELRKHPVDETRLFSPYVFRRGVVFMRAGGEGLDPWELRALCAAGMGADAGLEAGYCVSGNRILRTMTQVCHHAPSFRSVSSAVVKAAACVWHYLILACYEGQAIISAG